MSTNSVRIVFLGDASSGVRSVRQLETSFAGLGRAAKLAATAVGTAVVGSLALAVKSAVEFDRAMRNVQSLTKSSEKDFQALSRSVLALARTTGQGPKTLAEGLYDVVSSGFKAKDAITVLAASAKAATAGLTDTATATKAVVAILNAYHLSAADARRVSDVLFQEVNLGVNTFAELAQNIGDTAPQAAALKIPFEQVAAALATITLHGTSMAEASTQVSRVLTAMVKPTDSLAAEFRKMGYENGQAAVAALGFSGVIQRLSKDAKGNQETLADWLGDVRGIRGVLNLTGDNLETYTDLLNKMGDATKGVGATQAAFAEQAKSISFQWQLAKASLTAAAIPIGQLFFPALIKATQGVGMLADAINEHMPQIRAITQRTVAAISAEWTRLQPTLRRVAAFIQTNIVPIIKSAFHSLVDVARAVVSFIRTNWPQISSIARSVGAIVVAQAKLMATVWQALGPIVRALAPIFRAALIAIAAVARVASAAVVAAINAITAVLRAVLHPIDAVKSAWNALRRALSVAAHFVIPAGPLKAAVSGINAVLAAWNALRSAASHVINFKIHVPSIHVPGLGSTRADPRDSKSNFPPRAHGGFIPGPAPGAPVPILAHAGEVVLNRAQQDALGGARFIASMFGFSGDEGPQFATGGFVSPFKRAKPKRPKRPAHPLRKRARAASKAGKAAYAAADAFQQREEDLGRTITQLDREYSISPDATGNPGLDAGEIDALIAKKEDLLALFDQEKKALEDALVALQKAIAALVREIKSEQEAIKEDLKKLGAERRKKKPNRKLIASLEKDVSSRRHVLRTMQSELKLVRDDVKEGKRRHDILLPFDRRDVELDIADYREQKREYLASLAEESGGGSGGGEEAGGDLGGGSAAGLAAGERIQLLTEELGRVRLALGLQGVQVPIIGSFEKGTLTVPAQGLYELHGGETVTPAGRKRGSDGASLGDVHVTVVMETDEAGVSRYIKQKAVEAASDIARVHGDRAGVLRRSGRG